MNRTVTHRSARLHSINSPVNSTMTACVFLAYEVVSCGGCCKFARIKLRETSSFDQLHESSWEILIVQILLAEFSIPHSFYRNCWDGRMCTARWHITHYARPSLQ